MIYPSYGSGPEYKRDHIMWEAAFVGRKAVEPLSLPSGPAAPGVARGRGGELPAGLLPACAMIHWMPVTPVHSRVCLPTG